MAAVLLSDIMAQNNNNNSNSNASDDVKPTILHDFLGRGCAPVTKIAAASDVPSASSPSASVSGGGVGGGRGGGPVSTTSDLGSERQAGLHLEGVPFYGQKTDFSTSQIRYSGSKRSNSDSIFMAPSREAIPQLRPDFPETSHLMKMLRNVGGERHRWLHEDESSFMNMHQMRPTSSSSSLMAQQQPVKPDANSSKWERAIPVNVGPVLQYPPPAAAAQVVQYKYQPVQNRFKDANVNVNVNVGPSLISQSAADEGSRTGIKGSGILTSGNGGGGSGGGGGGVAEPGGSKQKSLIGNTDSGSTPSRQMTIFYGGQAHVFDDVHPNKADVIMALAGSNGGSWSTSFLPNPPVTSSGGQVMKDAEQKSEEKQ